MQPERDIATRTGRLCTQSFGTPTDPALLLLAGTGCSMDWWPPTFCRSLADEGFFVLRFDQHDTGRSTYDPPGQPGYGLPDLVDDALAVLDGYDLGAATWLGFSQGGWVSQLAALDHPDRVNGLVLIASRPTAHGPADPDLPEVSDNLLESWGSSQEPDWHDRDQVVAYLLDGERSLAADPFDEPAARAVVEACTNRAHQLSSAVVNHTVADQGPRWRERLGRITAPTLIFHGTHDPLFPIANAHALAREIPGARLEELSGVGHELPPHVWPQIIAAIAERR